MNQSNLAFALLARNDASDIARGENLSSAAYDVSPWVHAVAHTRAGYLILTGRPADAVVAIRQVIDEEMRFDERKEILYTLACAYEGCGDAARAAELRASAQSLVGDVLRWVERARATQPALATAS
jgi:predicted Zn-dependent protease